jgi:hypothetical protein
MCPVRRRLASLHLVRRASAHGRRLTRLSFSRLGRWVVCFPALRRRRRRLSFSRPGLSLRTA